MGSKIKPITWFWTWISTSWIGERDRWPLWVPVLLGCGICFYFALPVEPPLMSGWAAALICGALAWGLRAHLGISRLLLALTIVALGVGVSSLRTWSVAAPVLTQETGPVSLTGQVSLVEVRPKGLRVTLDSPRISRVQPFASPKRVRVTLMGKQPEILPGDWLQLRASLRPPPPPSMPGAFDFQRQSYFRGLGGVGFVFGKAKVMDAGPPQGWDKVAAEWQKLRLSIAISAQAALSGDTGAVAAALMTGQRGAISEGVLDHMRASGLAHLLAISGLHVGLVAGIVFFAVRGGLALVPALALRYPIKKWAAVLAMGGAGAYALLAGATVPTQRAFLMVALVLVAVLLDRRALSMRSVAWAALVILVFAPESLLGASFQLSFAAVVALIAVYEALRARTGRKPRGHEGWIKKGLRYVSGVGLTTLIAGVATGVFAAYHFNRVADFSLAANVVAVPVTALWIMPWALLGYVLMPLGLESLALLPMGWGIDIVLAVARTVAGWPGAVTMVPAFPVWGLALLSFGGLWAALWRRSWRFAGVPLAVVGLISGWTLTSPDVLIDGAGKLAAVKMADGGYRVSTLRAQKFERDVWLRRAGLMEPAGSWKTGGKMLRCDALGCVYTAQSGAKVSFVHRAAGALEDCARTDLVVVMAGSAPLTPDNCPAAALITQDQLARDGTHAVWLGENLRIQTVRETRGVRPWVLGVAKP
ncbi:ComEC/Rec2 family competence protein [Pseudomonadota bacterium]